MSPKAKAAPKPIQFSVSQLLAGKRNWTAGDSGPNVKLNFGFPPFHAAPPKNAAGQRSRYETTLLGKVLFGRSRLAFEVQEIDYDTRAIKKLVAKEKEAEQERFGFHDFCQDRDCPEWLEMFKARELAAKHSVQIKFEDIVRIDSAGNAITLHLSSTPTCYLKPAGEASRGNLEVGKDITGSAKTIVFFVGPASAAEGLDNAGSMDHKAFPHVQEMLMQQSPRLAALFQGLPAPEPEVAATPKGKKRAVADSDGPIFGSSQKRKIGVAGRSGADELKFERVHADEGTWLKKAVERFDLRAPLEKQMSEAQWKQYYEERVALQHDDSNDGDHEDPDEEEEKQPIKETIHRIQKSVRDTLASSPLSLDPETVALGALLTDWECNNADEREPRTVSSRARFYSPVANGRFVDLIYENHVRVRHSFTERDSYMWVRKGGVCFENPNKQHQDNDHDTYSHSRKTRFQRAGFEKLFELDYNEFRKRNQIKTSVAANAVLCSLGAHLFGFEGMLSNRKVLGLLLRCAGLGQFKENNGWPIAVMRRRFKCAKGERDTDTEAIAGEKDEEPSMGSCCLM